MRRRYVLLRSAAPVVLLIFAGCATVHESRDISPKAEAVLESMSKALAGARRFSFRARTSMDETITGGPTVARLGSGTVTVGRPDRLFATKRGEGANRDVWYDGKTVTILDRDRNVYAAVKAPGTVDRMLDFMIDEYDLVVPLADFLYSDPYEVLTEKVRKGEYLGVHTVDGRRCNHLAFHQDLVNWQIWIETGGNSLPRKLVITYLDSPDEPEFTAELYDWNLSPMIREDLFVFRPPAGAKRVDMRTLLEGGEGEGR